MTTSATSSAPAISRATPGRPTPRTVWFISAAVFVLLMAVAPRYGYFRDELYYLACGEHPAWGYVDQPPLICWISWLLQHTIGTSLYALRLLPALAVATTPWLTARLAGELGGSRRAEIFAALIAAIMPVAAGMAHLFTMNIFDFVFWTLLALILVRLENTGNPRLWIAFGATAGITVLNKYGVVFFLIALLAGIVITRWRRWFVSLHFWAGTLLAILIALPNFLWQQHRHFPFLELMANIHHNGRDVALPPLGFFLQQVQIVNPVSVLVVFCGAIYLLRSRRYRALGIAFVVFYVTMMLMRAKNYYLAPIYPMVFAAGAVAVVEWTDRPRLRWIPIAIGVLASLIFVLALPMLIPVLDVPHFQQYTQVTGLKTPEFEHHGRAALPQLYADMFGWQEMVEKAAAFYNTLTPEQKQNTAIWGNNYGVAGAIDFFGPRFGLPKAIAGHQSYFLWGPRDYHRPDMINLGSHDYRTLQRECDSVRVVGHADHPLSRTEEHFDIYYCQGLHFDLQQAWNKTKKWD
ncbi:MAG TPA: glycosyltransferase family 39 protein [Candidatus Saccharimonadales bacterium]|nr:glycosyltransferase family 39 protein [Candidatus Saccharimonadales bacterium]